MKAVVCLVLSLVGLISAQYAFRPGYKYVYKVRGRLMSGISDINTQYAGLEMKYKLAAQVVSPTTIVLKPYEFKAYDLNAELDGGWREAELQHETPVEIKPELLRYLESPIELTMNQGIVKSIKVEDYLPTWAVNIKKAQASHFVLDTTGARAVVTGNLNRNTNSVRPEEENTDSGFFYEVMESTVLGECETYYTVSQQGPFQTPYPLQRELQPGQVTSAENSHEDDLAQRGSSEEPPQQQQYQQDEDPEAAEQRHMEAFQKKYYYAQQQDQQDQQQRYYRPQAAQQYYAYRQYAQEGDSESAEDSRESRDGELPWPQAFDKFCNEQDQIYEIVKYVNFTACNKKPTLSYSTSTQFYARGGDNNYGTAFDRFVTSRYLACGKDRKQFTILSVKQEEQYNAGLRLNQRTVAGTMTNFTLESITKAQVPIKVQNPKVIEDLSYTFDPQEQRLQKEGRISHGYDDAANDNDSDENQTTQQPGTYTSESSEEQNQLQQESQQYRRFPRAADQQDSEESDETKAKDQAWLRYDTASEGKGQLPKPSLKRAPVNPYLSSPLQTSGMKKRIQDLMQEIKEDILTDKKSMAESETMAKISTVAKILRYLNYEDVEELYQKLAAKTQTQEDQTSRSVFLDAVAIAGTNPNIHFLVDLIRKKELTGEPAAQIVSSFPMYIRTPTSDMLKVIFQLADSSALEGEDQVKTAAILAMSNILYEACINSRIGETKYPVQLYGEFCEAKSVAREYAQFFINNLKQHWESREPENKHWASTYFAALANLGIKEVIPIVQKVLDQEEDPYFKVKAIFCLRNLVVSRSSENVHGSPDTGVDRQSEDLVTDELIEREVLPILVSVLNDRSEHPEVRMAAVSLLIYATPADMTIWQQIAFTTWHPASQELHAYIYSTLKSLSELQRPLHPVHELMTKKARAVLPLAKPWKQGNAKSTNFFHSQWMEHVQSSYIQHSEYFGSKDSIFPNYIAYTHNYQYGNGAQGATPIAMSLHGQTIQRLASFMVEQFMQKTSIDQSHPDLEGIHNILGISQREKEEKPEASLRLKIRNQMERLWSINEEEIVRLIGQAKAEFLPQLLNGINFNYQKTLHLVEHSMEMPSATGLPVHFHFRMPLHVSARGEIRAVSKNGLQDAQLQVEIHPVYAWRVHGKLSIKVPFSGKAYEAGVMRHVVVETPMRALIRRGQEGQIVFAVSPSPLMKGTPSGEIDLVTYHQKPYTAIITDECWPTIHKEGGKMEIVHAVEEPYKNSWEVESLQKAFGLNVKLEEESEYHDQYETPSGWTRFLKRFHTAGCYFNVGWMGAEHIRYVERKLVLDVSKSDSKTIGFAFGYDQRENPSPRSLWTDSESNSSESSEEGASEYNRQNTDSAQTRSSDERQQPTRGERRQVESADKFNEGHIVAVAVIGKRAPIRTVQENNGKIQKIFVKENPSTIQYLIQATKSYGRFNFRAASGDAANEAAESLPQTHPSLKVIREIVADAQNQKSQPDGCVEFEGEYDAPKHANRRELLVLRKRLLADDLEVKIKGEVQFGHSCSRLPYEIKVQGKMERGPKMTEWAKEKSPEAQKCKEDEQKGFSVSPICVEVAEQQAAALNQATFKIEFTSLPVQFVNRTLDAEDFLKAYLYPYLSHDQFHEGVGQNKMQVDFHMTPNKEFIDVTVTKPNSRFSFRGVKTTDAVKTVLPLTATQSLKNNVMDRTFRVDSEPSCTIEGNSVNTFDNVTYRFNEQVADDCYQVLAKDCSGREPVAVLLKDATAQKKEVVMLLGGQTKIELNLPAQSGSAYGRGNIQVEVNNQRVQLPKRIVTQDSGEQIAYITAMEDGGIQVISQQFQVATNGKWVYVQAHNSLRNRTCGLCGDFDGEKVGEFRGPKDCSLSSGSLLVASYSFQSLDRQEKGVCKIHQHAKEQLKHEQELCLHHGASQYQPNQQRYSQQSQRYYQSGQADEQCTKDFAPAIRQTVYDIINAALKPFEWLTQSRERLVHTIADNVRNKVDAIVTEAQNVKAISEKVHEAVCEESKKLQLHSLAIEAICKGTKGLQERAMQYYLNPIAEQTQCTIQPSNKDFNPAEVSKQIQYATYDESDQDDSPLPWVAAHQLPLPCEKQLELTLSGTISKYAYVVLFFNHRLIEAERMKIATEVKKAVVMAVRKTQGSNNFEHDLIQELLKSIDTVFPETGFMKELANRFVRRYTQFVLLKLCKFQKCCFAPQPQYQRQQQERQGYAYQYQQREGQEEQQQQSQGQQQQYQQRQQQQEQRQQRYYQQQQYQRQ